MKIQVPIYRAKKKRNDIDENIEGILLPNLKRFNGKSFIISNYTRMEDFNNAVEIDPSTLEITVDNKNWFSIENLYQILTSNEVIGIQQ